MKRKITRIARIETNDTGIYDLESLMPIYLYIEINKAAISGPDLEVEIDSEIKGNGTVIDNGNGKASLKFKIEITGTGTINY